MAKEKSGSGSVILRGILTQGAANGFIAGTVLTGLSSSGNDALVLKQLSIEFPSLLNAAAGVFEQEFCLSRAIKAAMPNVFDDDILVKYKHAWATIASPASFAEPGVLVIVPQYEIVVIEDTLHTMFKTLGCSAAGSLQFNAVLQPATVTESEKVGLLLQRIN